MASRKSRNWMHTIAFVVILALTVYVIRDLEFPRLPGLVGMNDIDNGGSQKKYALNLESWRI